MNRIVARTCRTTLLSVFSLAVILCSHFSQPALAQQRDGDEPSANSTAPSGRVNFNILQLLNGEYLEMFGAGTSRGILRGHPSIAGVELATTTADPLLFTTNNIERMQISSSGRIGIGTTPQDALHVFSTAQTVGTIRLQGGNTYAGFFGMWEGHSLLLSNNRHPGTGANYNTTVIGAQVSLWGGDTIFYSTSNGPIGNTTELMRVKTGGTVGIGTANPAFKLDVQGGTVNASGGLCIAGDCRTAWSQVGGSSSQWTTSGTSIYYNGGNVGIGTTTPNVKLYVAGDGRFTGSLTVDGNLAAKYQDLAEWVPATEQFAAGTVVVLDETTANQVTSSNSSYDTRVAGVVSEQPGIALGEKSENKVLVATTGRVRVRVDASKSPIRIGDLLVTSDVAGTAMKSEPITIGGRKMHAPGTLVGKALEPLEKGSGMILVLLSLQ